MQIDDLTQLTPKPLIATLEELRVKAVDSGTMSDWESSFLNDVIHRRKRLSERQAAIVVRINNAIAKAETYDTTIEPDDPSHIKVLKQIDLKDEDLSDWERKFMTDMKNRMVRGFGFSEKQRNLIVDMPARMSSNAQDKIRRAEQQKKAEAKRALQQQITTEAGFERVAELLKGALESGLKRPAITFQVVDAEGVMTGRKIVFRTKAQTPDIIEVASDRKYQRWVTVYGIIDSNAGTFTYNGLCPDEVVHFVRRVAEDPEAAAVENGMLTGNCVFCAAGLTDHRSTSVGYGPICAKRYALPWSEETYRQRLQLRVLRLQAVRSIRDGDDPDALHTVETITCGGCNKYVLHPVDYDREVQNDTNPETWACRNGCGSSADTFDEVEEKCPSRFVVDTSEFLKGAYAQSTGVTGTYDVIGRDAEIKIVGPIGGVEGDGSGFAEDEENHYEDAGYYDQTDGNGNPIPAHAGLPLGKADLEILEPTFDCPHCGKQYKSRAGRYNHLKKCSFKPQA